MQVTFLHQLNLFGFLSVVSFVNNCEVLFVWFFWTHASERQLLYFTHHTHIFFLKRTFFSLYSEYSSSKSDIGKLKTQNIIWTRASGTLRICIWEKNLGPPQCFQKDCLGVVVRWLLPGQYLCFSGLFLYEHSWGQHNTQGHKQRACRLQPFRSDDVSQLSEFIK